MQLGLGLVSRSGPCVRHQVHLGDLILTTPTGDHCCTRLSIILAGQILIGRCRALRAGLACHRTLSSIRLSPDRAISVINTSVQRYIPVSHDHPPAQLRATGAG
jgi:hypothetical protein